MKKKKLKDLSEKEKSDYTYSLVLRMHFLRNYGVILSDVGININEITEQIIAEEIYLN